MKRFIFKLIIRYLRRYYSMYITETDTTYYLRWTKVLEEEVT